MGQAKNRGSYETRKAQAEVRIEKEAAERKRKAQEYEDSLTPEQKKNRDKARLMLAEMEALARSSGNFLYRMG